MRLLLGKYTTRFYQQIAGKESFLRKTTLVSFWSFGILVVQLFLSPIITRLYTPSEYGIYAIFVSINANILLFTTLKYSETIVLQKNRYFRMQAFGLSLIISLFVAAFAFVGLVSIRTGWPQLNVPLIFVWMIPLSVIVSSIIEIITSYNLTKKKFTANGMGGLTVNLASRLFNIMVAFIYAAKSTVLIMGELFGKLSGVVVLFGNIRHARRKAAIFFRSIHWKGMKSVAREYRSFPLYYLPSSLMLGVSSYLPVYFLQWKFSTESVGAYVLGNSMLEVFNRLVPYAIAPVFLQKASELKLQSETLLAQKSYRLFQVMLLSGTLLFGLVAALGDFAFKFVFGADWEIAGSYTAALSIHNNFIFVVVALSEIYNVTGRQRLLFFNTIVNITVRAAALLLLGFASFSELQSLLIYSLASSLGGILYIWGVFTALNYKAIRAVLLCIASVFLLLITFILTNREILL